jgi:hypothetical protein
MTEATDVRDKVYGMVGLLKGSFRGFILPEVDYVKTEFRIFEEFARCCVETTSTLWMLEITVPPRETHPHLPSWVPDLSHAGSVCINWQPRLSRDPFKDPARDSPEPDDPGRLPVDGRCIGRVAQVFTRMPICDGLDEDEAKRLRIECLSEWTALALSLQDAADEHGIYQGDYMSALQRLTLGWNELRNDHEPVEQSKEKTSPAKRWTRHKPLSKEERRIKNARTIASYSDEVYDGAVLFKTTDGLLGISKGHVTAGDVIAQLCGGQYAFALRRAKVQTHEEGKDYTLVGIVDIDGLDHEHRGRRWEAEYLADQHRRLYLV